MKRHIPGLSSIESLREGPLTGAFLVRVAKVSYRWHPQKPFLVVQFSILEPTAHEGRAFSGRLYCSPKALWKLNWFLRDFGYDTDLLGRDEVDEKALLNLRGVVRTLPVGVNGHSYQNLEAFAPASEWDTLYSDVPEQEVHHDVQLHADR